MTSLSARRLAACCLIAPMLGLAACDPSGTPQTAATTVASVSPLDAAVQLLNQGDEVGAQKRLRPLLKANPNDPQANMLLESVKRDPIELLGSRSFAYTVQPGETMISLSQRFLGNRLKFYQLARYNHIGRPVALSAGTVLRIPGDPPRPNPPPRAEPASNDDANAQARGNAKAKATPSPSVAKGQAADPATALKLRGLGLAALNQGRVKSALMLLGRALTLDPANPVIARDLARARRIAGAVAEQH